MLIACGVFSTRACSSCYKIKDHLLHWQRPSPYKYQRKTLTNHSITRSKFILALLCLCTINKLPIDRCNIPFMSVCDVCVCVDKFILITFYNCIDMESTKTATRDQPQPPHRYNSCHLILMVILFVYSFFFRSATASCLFLLNNCCVHYLQQIQFE